MNELTIKGKAQVCGIKVPKISGGFGPNQPAMLAKTIAELHGMQTFHVNEAINSNRLRFKDNVDVINLKEEKIVIDLVDNNLLSKMEIAKSENIYLLSQRGYAKLLKIFNDDLAWERYDQILNEYFELKAVKYKRLTATAFNQDCKMLNIVLDNFDPKNKPARRDTLRAFADNHGIDISWAEETWQKEAESEAEQAEIQSNYTLPGEISVNELNSYFDDIFEMMKSGKVSEYHIQPKVFESGNYMYIRFGVVYELWKAEKNLANNNNMGWHFPALMRCFKRQSYYDKSLSKQKVLYFNNERYRAQAINIKLAPENLKEIFKIMLERQGK
jgi:hypothetical protein